jgi:hypothetical protein
MKRSASLSDLPALSVSDEDEDEPLEKKVKLASMAQPVEMAQPVSVCVCPAVCPLVGSVVKHCSRLNVLPCRGVPSLPHVTSYPPHPISLLSPFPSQPAVQDACISPAFQLLFRFNSLKCSWATSCRKLASAEAVDWDKVGNAVFVARPMSSPTSIACSPSSSAPSSSFENCNSASAPAPLVTFSLKATALQQLCAICSEQDRLRAQFISEVSKSLGVTVRKAASRLNNPYGANNIESLHVKSVEQVILNFQKLSVRMRLNVSTYVVLTTSHTSFRFMYLSCPEIPLTVHSRNPDAAVGATGARAAMGHSSGLHVGPQPNQQLQHETEALLPPHGNIQQRPAF